MKRCTKCHHDHVYKVVLNASFHNRPKEITPLNEGIAKITYDHTPYYLEGVYCLNCIKLTTVYELDEDDELEEIF